MPIFKKMLPVSSKAKITTAITAQTTDNNAKMIASSPPTLKIPRRNSSLKRVKFSPTTLNSPGSYYVRIEKYIAKVRKQKMLAQFLWLINERPPFITWNALEKRVLFEQNTDMNSIFLEHFEAIPSEIFKMMRADYNFCITKTVENDTTYWCVEHEYLDDPYQKSAIFTILRVL